MYIFDCEDFHTRKWTLACPGWGGVYGFHRAFTIFEPKMQLIRMTILTIPAKIATSFHLHGVTKVYITYGKL